MNRYKEKLLLGFYMEYIFPCEAEFDLFMFNFFLYQFIIFFVRKILRKYFFVEKCIVITTLNLNRFQTEVSSPTKKTDKLILFMITRTVKYEP